MPKAMNTLANIEYCSMNLANATIVVHIALKTIAITEFYFVSVHSSDLNLQGQIWEEMRKKFLNMIFLLCKKLCL